MSDALCGPSNALQNFQKHASVDRTLQQDRLISRQSPSHGFRSQNPSEGILDPEFAAFESSNSVGAPLPDIQHGGHFIAPPPQMPMPHAAEAPNWAADFQNLHISASPQPTHHQPRPSAAPMSAAPQQAWHGEFMRQQQQQTSVLQQNQPFSQRFQPSFTSNYAMNSSTMGNYVPAQEAVASKTSAVDAFDESAFEAAFEQAKADMTSQFEASALETDVSDVNLDNKSSTEEVSLQPTNQETIRIGSDTIPQVDRDDSQMAANDADELARTAGHLLNSVSHETNQKFRESNFLALMRRIRDREVQVEGDEFRESLHPGGKYYPGGQRAQEKQTNHDTTTHNFDGNSTVPDERNPTPFTGSTADDDTLYAAWNHGDSWA